DCDEPCSVAALLVLLAGGDDGVKVGDGAPGFSVSVVLHGFSFVCGSSPSGGASRAPAGPVSCCRANTASSLKLRCPRVFTCASQCAKSDALARMRRARVIGRASVVPGRGELNPPRDLLRGQSGRRPLPPGWLRSGRDRRAPRARLSRAPPPLRSVRAPGRQARGTSFDRYALRRTRLPRSVLALRRLPRGAAPVRCGAEALRALERARPRGARGAARPGWRRAGARPLRGR